MNRLIFFFSFICIIPHSLWAQLRPDSSMTNTFDTIKHTGIAVGHNLDSLVINYTGISRKPDSLIENRINRDVLNATSDQISWELMKHNPYFNFSAPFKEVVVDSIKKFSGKELLFYTVVFLFVIVGLLKRLFPKYFNDLFRLFFRTTLKQKQVKEQLMQTPLPSLMLNVFFVLSGGLYISLLVQHFHLVSDFSFWQLFLYSGIALSAIYFVKFIGLKIAGWVFNLQEVSDSYIFIVFIINKMIGILLLPLLLIISFSIKNVYLTGVFLSFCLIGALLFYRFILSFSAIRHQIKVNPFHFFLYLCAFEIAPLLIIYKSLLLIFNITS